MGESKERRFWNKIRKTGEHWLWEGALCSDGYGSFRWNGRIVSAHRLSWLLHYGPIPDGLSVLHTCDIRNCIYPEHLFLGTQLDNMQDAAKKGRLFDRSSARGDKHGSHTHPESVLRGAANGSATLTKEQVVEIRALYPGKTQSELAKLFNVNQITISRVVRRITYK